MENLLKRSEQLMLAAVPLLAKAPFHGSPRITASRMLCEVSFEHAESVRILLSAGNFTSALGVLRIQYEALVKAVWALYAAPDAAIARLHGELRHETAAAADRTPSLGEMLRALDGKAPPGAATPLSEFKEYSWRPLSSYVHGGIHALTRRTEGYPEDLLAHAAKSSNGLLLMAAMMVVILSGDPANQGKVRALQRAFADCCPSPST